MLKKNLDKLDRKSRRLTVIPYTRVGDSKTDKLNKIIRKEKMKNYGV